MGDREQEKGRDTRKRRVYVNSYKDREDKQPQQCGARRLHTILTKPDSERSDRSERGVAGSSMKQKNQESQEKPLSQPTIILRTRDGDNRNASVSNQSGQRVKKENESAAPLYQLASKQSNNENTNPLAPLPQMKATVKLIDDQLQFSDAANEFLAADQNDFLVIGVIGQQGVGKSTLMSHLAGNPISKKKLVFKTQTEHQQEIGMHCTTGIDLLVTPNRVILLDSQPILSPSILERLIQHDTKKVGHQIDTGSFLFSSENMVEISSLQIAGFLFTACHIVIVLQDWFFDPNLLRFIQTAEMLKPPSTTSRDEEYIEYFPHLVFAHSYSQPSDFTKERIQLMQNVYSQIFSRSRFHIQTGLGMANAGVMESLPYSVDSLNLFLLPDFLEEDTLGHFKGHPGYSELMEKMRYQLHGATPSPISHTPLTEKNWLLYASKVWDSLKTAMAYHEYSHSIQP